MPPIRLLDLGCFARPGDKGPDVDVSLFAPDAEVYAVLCEQVTAEAVGALYGNLVAGGVRRWEVPNVRAIKLLLGDALGGGGPSSLRADNLGKALAGALLRLEVQVSPGLLDRRGPRPRPPRDPYAGAPWLVEGG